jgi:Domain of unknown function (DUF4145)
MGRVKTPENFDQMLHELDGESDRAAILVGTSFMEFALEQAIEGRLREPANGDELDMLFDDRSAIFGTLSNKIWGAYFLKVIGPDTCRDMHLIRVIRNYAAHNPNEASFDRTSEIANRCRQLKLAADATVDRAIDTDMRRRFLATVQFFASNLLARAGDESAEIGEAYNRIAPSLSK